MAGVFCGWSGLPADLLISTPALEAMRQTARLSFTLEGKLREWTSRNTVTY